MYRKRLLIFIFVMLLSIMIKDIAYSDDNLSCIKPVLTSKFGVISTIKGIIITVNDDKMKAPEKNIYIKVKEVNGQNRIVTLKCIGFDNRIDKMLSKAKTDSIIELKGFESIIADGLPDNMREYYAWIPSAKQYKITNVFVVVSERW